MTGSSRPTRADGSSFAPSVSAFRATGDVRPSGLDNGPSPRPPGPEVVPGATTSTLAFAPVALADPETAKQWHLGMLGDMEAIWADYTGKGVSVGVYDSGIQRAHWDLDGNYDSSRHVVVDGKTYDGDWHPLSGDIAHGTAVAGLIAAERNGRGGVGVSYGAHVTGINIFNPLSEDGAKPGIYINADDVTKFVDAFSQSYRYDVVNHSWGGMFQYSSGTSRTVAGTIFNTLSNAMANAATVGRGGLGTITVGASGNWSNNAFGATQDQSDSWKADRHIITVGAYRGSDGSASFYSNGGAHVLISAPSSDFANLKSGADLYTTDLLSYWGYNLAATPGGKNDYTDTFGGTSGATPIVTGVVSLMLDANEGLGWRDVSNILAASAKMPVSFATGQTHVMSTEDAQTIFFMEKGGTYLLNNTRFTLGGADGNVNGGRLHFSNDYGYGAVDAYSAVRMAEVWGLFGAAKTSANETSADTGMVAMALAVPETDLISHPIAGKVYGNFVGNDFAGKTAGVSLTIASDIAVEHVDLTLKFRTLQLYDVYDENTGEYVRQELDVSLTGLRFRVIAPDGTSAFVDTYGRSSQEVTGAQEFTFGLAAFRGVESAGTWRVEFENLLGIEVTSTTITGAQLKVYGSTATANDVYSYTDEFFTMAAIAGEAGRKVVSDTDGGTDWINAAAVTSAVNLSLVAGQASSFGGKTAFTIARTATIENAVTGDGNDTLFGNRFDNRLYGMRGNDRLNGGGGNDTLFGGTGRDTFVFDTAGTSGKDRILDWSIGDTIATSKALRGVDSAGRITLGANATLLLDGTTTGDTVELAGRAGAVLQAMGKTGDGYWSYAFVDAGNAAGNNGVIHESAAPAGIVATGFSPLAAMLAAADPSSSAVPHDSAFYLYDAMGDAMASGVQLYA